MTRSARIALLVVSIIFSLILAFFFIHFFPKLTAYAGLISAGAVVIVAVINVAANIVQIIDFFTSKFQPSNELKTETDRDLLTPILLDIRQIKELINPTTLKKIDLTVWKSKAKDYLFFRLNRKTKDAITNFYNEAQKYNEILEKLHTRIRGIISTSLYEFSENVLVPPVDWEGEYLEGYSEKFNKHCDEIAESTAIDACIEVLNSERKLEFSHALYSAAFNLLAEDDFKELGFYINEEDYETLGGTAVDMANSFSEKTLKKYVDLDLFQEFKSQIELLKLSSSKNEQMIEKRLEN